MVGKQTLTVALHAAKAEAVAAYDTLRDAIKNDAANPAHILLAAIHAENEARRKLNELQDEWNEQDRADPVAEAREVWLAARDEAESYTGGASHSYDASQAKYAAIRAEAEYNAVKVEAGQPTPHDECPTADEVQAAVFRSRQADDLWRYYAWGDNRDGVIAEATRIDKQTAQAKLDDLLYRYNRGR